MDKRRARLALATAMVLWSTLGVIRRYIDFSSGLIAMVRGLTAVLVIVIFLSLFDKKINFQGIKNNWQYILAGGVLLGSNWVLLFEAYQHTTVAAAELFYYTNPLFLVILAPWLLKEKITGREIVFVLVALLGMFLLSGAYGLQIVLADLRGIALSTAAALEVAFLIIVNKKIHNVGIWENTLGQLSIATICLVPYLLYTGELFRVYAGNVFGILLMLIVGLVHTGFAYFLYYGSIPCLNAQEISLLGYLDPVLAVLWGWLFLGEILSPLQFAGALLILGALWMNDRT